MKIFYIILFISLNLYNQNGIVEYEGILSLNKEIKPEIKELINQVKNKNAKYILKFNDSLSSFEAIESMNLNPKEEAIEQLRQSFFLYKFTFYNNKSNLLYREIEPKLYTIDTLKYQWEITRETKAIDNYQCIKAFLNEEITNSKGEVKTRTITAWFSPYMPFSFGPMGYSGLPGLILELELLGNKYVAKKIDFTNKKIDIIYPKGKFISIKENRERMGLN
jgi:GLPGLI family protein